VLDDIARDQAGIFSRAQAIACGYTDEMIEANVVARRWRRVLRGIYSQSTGPLTRSAELWASLLRAGEGAVLSHETAAELHGLDRRASKIHITVPAGRQPKPGPGIAIHQSKSKRLVTRPERHHRPRSKKRCST
jgi:hypothetical protein